MVPTWYHRIRRRIQSYPLIPRPHRFIHYCYHVSQRPHTSFTHSDRCTINVNSTPDKNLYFVHKTHIFTFRTRTTCLACRPNIRRKSERGVAPTECLARSSTTHPDAHWVRTYHPCRREQGDVLKALDYIFTLHQAARRYTNRYGTFATLKVVRMGL
jgi:hypothetical protein